MLKKIDTFIRHINHRRIDWMRAFNLKVIQWIFKNRTKLSSHDLTTAPILVFRLDDKIGDSVAATGFLYQLKQQCPQNKLIVLTGPHAEPIYKTLPFIDSVRVLKKGFLNTLKAYFILSGSNYRFIFNTSHLLTPRVIFLNSLLTAFQKITFLNQRARSFTQHVQYDSNRDHITVRYQKALQAVGLKVFDLDYQIQLADLKSSKKVAHIFQELRKKYKKIIVLNCFAGARLRNLNQMTTLEIVQEFLEKSPDSLIVSLASKDDMNRLVPWIKDFANEHWICFQDDTSLSFNLEVIKHCDLVVTPDTSFVHIGAAFKKPLIAIYREDEGLEKNSQIWAPYRTKYQIVIAKFDPKNPFDINTVDPKKVVEKTLELLSDLS